MGSTLDNTETVTTTGNGSYTTPTGYTLPTSGAVTGTYQWDASYSSDSNNNAFSENNATNEQVVVSSCEPGDHDDAERDHRRAPDLGDVEGHGGAVWRLFLRPARSPSRW